MEIFKDIEGYEGLYQISNFGNVRSFRNRKERILKPGLDHKGYNYVSLCVNSKRKNFKVHRLVGKSFIPNPNNNPQINHKNGIKIDNHTLNLEWVTQSENMLHAQKNGFKPVGSNAPHAKLIEAQVIDIRNEYKNGVIANHLAKKYKVNS